jgi:hypothetical protein
VASPFGSRRMPHRAGSASTSLTTGPPSSGRRCSRGGAQSGANSASPWSAVTGRAIPVTFAGRTDRGVHADGQVAHGDVASPLPDERLLKALNAVLPTDLAIWRLQTVHGAFHARYDARWREYRYQVWNAPVRHPGLARQVWHIVRSLDPVALDAATARLLGEHDFAAFAGQGLGVPGRARCGVPCGLSTRSGGWSERRHTPIRRDESWSSGFAPTASCRRWCARSSARRSRLGRGSGRPSGSSRSCGGGIVLSPPLPRRRRAYPSGVSGTQGCDQPSAVGAILADGQAGGTTDEQAES